MAESQVSVSETQPKDSQILQFELLEPLDLTLLGPGAQELELQAVRPSVLELDKELKLQGLVSNTMEWTRKELQEFSSPTSEVGLALQSQASQETDSSETDSQMLGSPELEFEEAELQELDLEGLDLDDLELDEGLELDVELDELEFDDDPESDEQEPEEQESSEQELSEQESSEQDSQEPDSTESESQLFESLSSDSSSSESQKPDLQWWGSQRFELQKLKALELEAEGSASQDAEASPQGPQKPNPSRLKTREIIKWRTVLLQQLGPKWRKHVSFLAVTLEAVNTCLKPAYLWDVGPPITRQNISSLVRTLKISGLLREDICLLELAGDYLIADLRLLEDSVVEFRSGLRAYVDLGADWDEAEVVKPNTRAGRIVAQTITTFLHALSVVLRESETECMTVPLQESWCVPSLFGVLVGLPLVYWYEHPSAADNVDVSMCVFKVWVAPKELEKVELFSFSVPKHLGFSCKTLVEDWFERLDVRCNRWLMALDISVEEALVPQVIM